jgi:hypothetical protein
MQFDGAFGPPELGPIKHLQAQINGARIHTDQSIFEPELSLPDFDLNPAPVKQLHEDVLIQLPGAVFIGIGQRGMTRSRNAQVFQLPLAASKASGNLTEGMGPAQLAEKHRDELVPTREFFDMTFCLCDRNQLLEFQSRKQLQQLAEYATKSIHQWPSLNCAIGLADSI